MKKPSKDKHWLRWYSGAYPINREAPIKGKLVLVKVNQNVKKWNFGNQLLSFRMRKKKKKKKKKTPTGNLNPALALGSRVL